MIIARAPTRISLFGGGTDVDPFASEYGGKVLNMAINLRHECTLYPKQHWSSECSVSAMDSYRTFSKDKIPVQGKDKEFDLIYEVVRSYELLTGFSFVDSFEGIQSAGLGSSASAAVSMIGAFNHWLGINESRLEIAEKAWRMEINLGWTSGKQDQYASVLGGVNFFEFDHRVWNEPIEKGIAEDFVRWCVLVFSGRTRHSAVLQDKLKERMSNNAETVRALKKMRTLAWEGRDALKRRDYEKVGALLDESWELKKITNPEVTNVRLDNFFLQAKKAGAAGGKVLGAGGEGYILFIVEPKKRRKFIKEMEDNGLKEIDFSPDWNGLEVRRL